jgi:hypothetical protein
MSYPELGDSGDDIGDGFRLMKRPHSGDARSAPVRCVKQEAVRWQGGVPRTGRLWFGLRGDSCILSFILGRLICLLISLDC